MTRTSFQTKVLVAIFVVFTLGLGVGEWRVNFLMPCLYVHSQIDRNLSEPEWLIEGRGDEIKHFGVGTVECYQAYTKCHTVPTCFPVFGHFSS